MKTSIVVLAMVGACWGIAGCVEGGSAPRGLGAGGKFREVGNGTVAWTGSDGLNVREAPSKSSAKIGWLAQGTSVTVVCQTEGDWVGNSNVWDFIEGEDGYVSDAFVNSGHGSWIPGVPHCGEPDDGCGDVDYAGFCDDTTLVWCEDDALREVDCAQTGQSCGWRDDDIGNDCLGGGGGGSGDRLTIGEIVGGDYVVSQWYGPTNFDGGYSYCHSYGSWGGLVHCGIDIAIPNGTPLFVAEGATVTIVGSPYFEDWNRPNAEDAGELRMVTAAGTEIIYGHMSRIDLWEGQSVAAGDWSGLSGYANGDHVHIEVRVLDGSTVSGFATVDPATYFGL